jgi:hypothetical protein
MTQKTQKIQKKANNRRQIQRSNQVFIFLVFDFLLRPLRHLCVLCVQNFPPLFL